MKVVLATRNKGKLRELRQGLLATHLQSIPQADLNIKDIEETGTTFVENALIKARHASSLSRLPAIADDSGLVVPYLKQSPGIYSARYAGAKASAEQNIRKLLNELEQLPFLQRKAFFYCVIVFINHTNDPMPLIAEGRWQGYITEKPVGASGFGYDPIFFIPTENKTAAELTLDRKNEISHRGIALQHFIKQIMAEER